MNLSSLRQAAQAEMKKRGLAVPDAVTPEEQAERVEEKRRCALDVAYWARKYGVAYDPRLLNPFIPFDLFPRQEQYLDWLRERERTGTSGVVEKSKDVGCSWLSCHFLMHRWLFKTGFIGGIGSRKLEYVDNIGDPKSLFEKLRMILRNQPHWMMPAGFEWKKHSFECKLLNPAKKSALIGEGGVEIGRGGRSSIYIVDEYNYLEHPELADAALRDNTNCMICVGTPNGMVGIYEKRSHWPCFTFHWKDDPRKNDQAEDGTFPWYERQKEKHRDQPWIVRQEIDIDYLGSGFPRFDNRAFLTELKKRMPPPVRVEMGGATSWCADVKTWADPEHLRQYTIIVDVAEGESNQSGDPDWSVAHVYDEEWNQVCHYRGRPDTHSLAVDLAALGEMYNWALLVIERTGPGLSTISALTEEFGYPCVWGEARGETAALGFRATHNSKIKSEDDLASMIVEMEQGFPRFTWNEPNTADELIHYMRKPNGRCEAEAGWHDDEVSVCRMAAHILPQVHSLRYEPKRLPEKPKTFGNRRLVRR